MTVFVENQFKPLKANNMKQFNESIFKSSLSRISAKSCERHSFSSLVSYSTLSLFRLLLSAHDYHTFIHILVVLTVFLFTAFSASFCIPPQNFPGILAQFFENKGQNVIVFRVVMLNLLYHQFFAVMPLLRGNSNTTS